MERCKSTENCVMMHQEEQKATGFCLDSSVSAASLAKIVQSIKEIHFPKIRPQFRSYMNLGVAKLPKQKIRQPDFPGVRLSMSGSGILAV